MLFRSCRITVDPGETAIVDLITGISETREACVRLVERYQDRKSADCILAAAPAQGQAILSRLHVSDADARLYTRLASSVIYANASLRGDPSVLGKNHQGQSGLWAYAISGDLPIVLLRIGDAANMDLARHVVQAHAYWRLHGLAVDLVILSEDHDDHEPILHEQITKLIAACGDAGRIDQPGGIFVRPADKVSEEDGILLQTVARVAISDGDGSLAQQLERRCATPTLIPLPTAEYSGASETRAPTELQDQLAERELLFCNGSGGFSADGCEYVITTTPGRMTPAPWVNVLANPTFGTLVSESGRASCRERVLACV